jgi:hypothetical protein
MLLGMREGERQFWEEPVMQPITGRKASRLCWRSLVQGGRGSVELTMLDGQSIEVKEPQGQETGRIVTLRRSDGDPPLLPLHPDEGLLGSTLSFLKKFTAFMCQMFQHMRHGIYLPCISLCIKHRPV